MHYASRRMQFMDREPIYHDHIPPPSSGHGFYDPEETMTLRWNSRVGVAYIDGAHVTVRLLPVRLRSRVDRRFLRSSFFPFARYVMNLTFVLTRVKYIHQSHPRVNDTCLPSAYRVAAPRQDGRRRRVVDVQGERVESLHVELVQKEPRGDVAVAAAAVEARAGDGGERGRRLDHRVARQ
jgi:hypothetical protein